MKCWRCKKEKPLRMLVVRRVEVRPDGDKCVRLCTLCVEPEPQGREYLGLRGGLVPRQREKNRKHYN